ncbi:MULTISPECIES: hypothetical protein [Streptomyces]|uniref:hypothetical protein n=1 Tax=Streptomyces TaxID=1883 RepID=UPI00163D0B60|nr:MULTISPECIES: hypothetical protein [Streptomyces]MBC2878756.1 hypothetical protein [Streptomyces sp. TYQ1024]UBI39323.1 hypothetical protein K7I03_24590 [Streptomyces mobaraensis]UKW31903.1 hypothetical protein MCU78_24525 [Streptomyces sp. TYQ1024]
MGWTVLYIAFGVVGLWLLGEVLFQHKARLRWRLLAFTGFLGVVAGVVIPSVAVIAVGAVAFAIGQVYVTLSFRRGFSAGWALRRKGRDEAGPASSASGSRSAARSASRGGRRRGRPERGATAEPAASDAPPAPGTPGAGRKRLTAAEAGAATTMMPTVPQQPTDEHGVPGPAGPAGSGPGDTAAFPAVGDAASVFGGGGYDYGQAQEQYPAYSDPYIGAGAGAGVQPSQGYEQPYDAYGQQGAYPQQYGQQPQGQQYGQYGQYDMDTPPGGVWVPQQRQGGGDGQAPPPPAPPQGYGY